MAWPLVYRMRPDLESVEAEELAAVRYRWNSSIMAGAGFYAIESHTIRFGKDGRWYADGDLITNERIAALFSRHVTRGDDGAYWLVVGDERARIEVEDTPFVVVRVDGDPENGFRVGLNDGSSEPLAGDSLRLGEDDVLSCAVKGDRYRARFLRPAQLELLSHARPEGSGFVLPLARGRVKTLSPGP
jgi:hypothetical protein